MSKELAFSRILASEGGYNTHNKKKTPIDGDGAEEAFLVKLLKDNIKGASSRFGKKIEKERLFSEGFLKELAKNIVTHLVHTYQPSLLTSPCDFIADSMHNEKACQKLFDAFYTTLWDAFLKESNGKENYQQNYLLKASGKTWSKDEKNEWCQDKALKLLNITFNGSLDFINKFQLRSQSTSLGCDETDRGSISGFFGEWMVVELEGESGKRVSLNDGLGVSEEKREEATQYSEIIVKHILGAFPFALVTNDEFKVLIKTLLKDDSNLSLKDLAANVEAYIPLKDSKAKITKLLKEQQQTNIDAYVIYVTMRGGNEKFCPLVGVEDDEFAKIQLRREALQAVLALKPELTPLFPTFGSEKPLVTNATSFEEQESWNKSEKSGEGKGRRHLLWSLSQKVFNKYEPLQTTEDTPFEEKLESILEEQRKVSSSEQKTNTNRTRTVSFSSEEGNSIENSEKSKEKNGPRKLVRKASERLFGNSDPSKAGEASSERKWSFTKITRTNKSKSADSGLLEKQPKKDYRRDSKSENEVNTTVMRTQFASEWKDKTPPDGKSFAQKINDEIEEKQSIRPPQRVTKDTNSKSSENFDATPSWGK